MATIISGPGAGLPFPVALYPANLYQTPYDVPNNYVGLPPGGVAVIPATGTNGYIVDTGAVSLLQWLDPVTGIWRIDQRPPGGMQIITSDGFTRRVANLTGCAVSAIVTNGGSGFASATATITANVGGSTWQPIVGGSLSVSTITNAGANYALPPILHIAAPPNPGIPATGYCTIANGTVSAVSLTNFGAGYMTATVGCAILANPVDPNFGTVTQASVTLILNAANATAITGALCTYNGAALATLSAITLTASGGAGSGATITPVVMQCVSGVSVVAGGAGWAGIGTSGGGTVSTSAIVNPAVELTNFRPRQAQIGATSSSLGALSAPTIIDPGLFVGTPVPLVLSGGMVPATLASVTLTLGSFEDFILIQPL